MNLICLINLLEEKNYINVEIINGNYSKEIIGYYLESKYPEVIDKIEQTIENNKLNDTIVTQRTDYSWESNYRIINIPKIIKDIEEYFNLIDKESGRYCWNGEANYVPLINKITEKTSHKFNWGSIYYGGNYVTSIKRKQNRINKEQKDKNEMLKFIESLP